MPTQREFVEGERGSFVHYNHPLFNLRDKLCFEFGQQSLNRSRESDYHLGRNLIPSFLRFANHHGRTKDTDS